MSLYSLGRVLLVAGVLALAACEETSTPETVADAGPDTGPVHKNPCNKYNALCKKCPGFVSASGWCWQNPIPQGHYLADVWCSGSTDVFAVGQAGTVLHGRGGSWRRLSTGCDADLYGVWGLSRTDLWAVGSKGAIWRFDGETWTDQKLGITNWLNDVWGADGTHLFAVGRKGSALVYDGASWAKHNLIVDLYAVHGTSAANVWAVGDEGMVAHYNGKGWTKKTPVKGVHLRSVFCLGPKDVYVGGTAGVILHFDGKTWRQVHAKGDHTVKGIWGTGKTNLYASLKSTRVGIWDKIARYDGKSWTTQWTGKDVSVGAICGNDAKDIYTVEDLGMARYDGKAWKSHSHSVVSIHDLGRIPSVWGSSSSNVFAVVEPTQYNDYDKPSSIVRFDGTRWSVEHTQKTSSLRQVWGKGPSNVWVVGTQYGANKSKTGLVLRYDGKTWKTFHTIDEADLHAVWSSSGTDVFVLGYQSRARVYHYNGAAWTRLADPKQSWYRTIRGTSSTDVYLLGEDVFRWDGAAWKKQGLKLGKGEMYDAWGANSGAVFAVGYDYGNFSISPGNAIGVPTGLRRSAPPSCGH